jgi:hypothetical protein
MILVSDRRSSASGNARGLCANIYGSMWILLNTDVVSSRDVGGCLPGGRATFLSRCQTYANPEEGGAVRSGQYKMTYTRIASLESFS